MLTTLESPATVEVIEVDDCSLRAFPEAGEYDDDADAPDWLRFASYTLGRTIPVERWEALTSRQREYVRESLRPRGLDVWKWRAWGQISIVTRRNSPVAIQREGGPVSYGMPADFLRHAESISFVVHEQNTAKADWMLGEFLADLRRYLSRGNRREPKPIPAPVVVNVAALVNDYHAAQGQTAAPLPLALSLLVEMFGGMEARAFDGCHIGCLRHSLNAMGLDRSALAEGMLAAQRVFKWGLMAKLVNQLSYQRIATASQR